MPLAACLASLLALHVQVGIQSTDADVFERRDAAFNAALELDVLWRSSADELDRVFELVLALEDEDQRVRAFAARALERIASRPEQDGVSSFVRKAFASRLECEDSVFVKPWLERGVDPPRPDLAQSMWAASEAFPRSPARGGPSGSSWERTWADWIDDCPGAEPNWRQARQQGGTEVLRHHDRRSAKSLGYVASLLGRHVDELIERMESGDSLAHLVLLRIDRHLRLRMEWMTDEIEREANLADSLLWTSLGRGMGFESFEEIVKPNFHHMSAGGSAVSLLLGEEILPAVLRGLVHGMPRDRGQAMRLLRDMGEGAEIAAPFVIHAWGRGRAGVESIWLGVRENLYDAIAGAGEETMGLVAETLRDSNVHRREHACRALPRFGGRAAKYARALELAQADSDVAVRREAFIAHRALVPASARERRLHVFEMAKRLIDAIPGDPELQRDLGLKLEAALSDSDVTVRAFAARGLSRLAVGSGGGYLATLRAHLKRFHEHEAEPAVAFWLGLGYGNYRWPLSSNGLSNL